MYIIENKSAPGPTIVSPKTVDFKYVRLFVPVVENLIKFNRN